MADANKRMCYAVRVFGDGKPVEANEQDNYPEMDFVALLLGRTYDQAAKKPFKTAVPSVLKLYVMYWAWYFKDRLEALEAVETLVANGYDGRCSLQPYYPPVPTKKETG